MNRTRAILSTAAAFLLVSGLMATSASGAPRATPSNPGPVTTQGHEGRDGHGGSRSTGHDGDRDAKHRCDYPPQRTPDLSLSGPRQVKKNQRFDLTGRISVHECGLAGRKIGLYADTDHRGHLHRVAQTTSDAHGTFTFARQRISKTTHYVAISASGGGYTIAISNVVTVKVSGGRGR